MSEESMLELGNTRRGFLRHATAALTAIGWASTPSDRRASPNGNRDTRLWNRSSRRGPDGAAYARKFTGR